MVVDPALGREPSVPELAAELRVEPAEIANIDLAGDSYHSASLDAVASHDGASIADALGDYDAALAPALSVSATPEQLPVLRSLVRTVAAHYAPSLDGLSDLVLAVDEAATILITHPTLQHPDVRVRPGNRPDRCARNALHVDNRADHRQHLLLRMARPRNPDRRSSPRTTPPATPGQNWATTITLTKGVQGPS